MFKLFNEDVNGINANTNKLPFLLIDLLNAKREQVIRSINNQMNYTRNNEEVFGLSCNRKDVNDVIYKLFLSINYKISLSV